ncbi:MAG: type II toxin-antitoxin system YoeB family toxin [Syntrophomonadaceae bacterium]|jgi:toxin YoeB
MSNLFFSDKGWDDYLYWQVTDKRITRKVNELLKDILRNGYEGIGKPERLKYGYFVL